MEFHHISVLLRECIDGLNINPDGIYVDGTAGGAGHSFEIATRLKGGKLYAIDRDPDAVATAAKRLENLPAKVVNANYSEILDVLAGNGESGCDGILLDLGVSSFQLDTPERGFSYHGDAPLDMRMSKEGISAKEVVNEYSPEELTRILFTYGEENYARQIVRGIIKAREEYTIETTAQLSDIIRSSVPAKARKEKNPCRKTFQAIRIEVNHELDFLASALENAFLALNSGGRLCIITFHSLEDRMVKQFYAGKCKGCTCPPQFPVCVCGNKPKAKLINKKPIVASEDELEVNSRSRSAKLRILEKI